MALSTHEKKLIRQCLDKKLTNNGCFYSECIVSNIIDTFWFAKKITLNQKRRYEKFFGIGEDLNRVISYAGLI